jgi:two-component system, LytTR family, sensor kinase
MVSLLFEMTIFKTYKKMKAKRTMNIDRVLRIVIHGIFWIVFLMISTLISMIPQSGGWPEVHVLLPHYIINLIWAITIFYSSYFYLIRFFEKRQLLKYLLLSVCLSILISALFFPIHKLFLRSFDLLDFRVVLPPVVGTFIIAQCGCLVRGFENWLANIRLKPERENRNLRNELELLKSQINPHFLFNTLNNIDTLIGKSPADASASLITLSDMLRYMIYETNTDFVPLEKEVEYLRRYVSLQQLRYKKKDYVRTDFVAVNKDWMVAPLLFLPFVENAFKYSCDSQVMPVIDIRMDLENDTLTFLCENRFDPDKIATPGLNGGVGLENVKRRLALLYPQKHVLHITKIQPIFRVELTLLRH